MEREGLKPLFDISDLAVMGLLEVIPSIPKILRHIRNVVEDIIRVRPDVVVTIDSWSFSARIHKALQQKENRSSANSLCGATGLGLEEKTGADDV